jgi:hypothetical protein
MTICLADYTSISLSIYAAPAQTGAVFLCLDLFPPKQLVCPDDECLCSFFDQESRSNWQYSLALIQKERPGSGIVGTTLKEEHANGNGKND